MNRRPPSSTRTDTPFPYTTPFGALQAVPRNHPEDRGNPPFCGTMSRGNERDLAQSLKKRCADKYIAMSRDIAFILLSPATSRKPSNLPNPTLNPSETRQKMRTTLDRAPLPEPRRHRRVSNASCACASPRNIRDRQSHV